MGYLHNDPDRFGLKHLSSQLPSMHLCSTPGNIYRFFSWLFRDAVEVGDLWRCECGEVWQFSVYHTWHASTLEQWLECGGHK